jgi:hypothetical protein
MDSLPFRIKDDFPGSPLIVTCPNLIRFWILDREILGSLQDKY